MQHHCACLHPLKCDGVQHPVGICVGRITQVRWAAMTSVVVLELLAVNARRAPSRRCREQQYSKYQPVVLYVVPTGDFDLDLYFISFNKQTM